MILFIVEYTLNWPLEFLGDLDWLFMKFKQSPKCALAMKVEVPAWFWSRTGPRRTSTASSSRSATSSTRRPQRSVSPAPPPSRPTSRRPRPSSRPSTRPSGRSPRHWSWPTLQVGTKILFHMSKVFAKVFLLDWNSLVAQFSLATRFSHQRLWDREYAVVNFVQFCLIGSGPYWLI